MLRPGPDLSEHPILSAVALGLGVGVGIRVAH